MKKITIITFTLIIVFFNGCGGGGGGTKKSGISCNGLSWEATSAQPLDYIVFSGLSADMNGSIAIVKTLNDTNESFTYINSLTEGKNELLVPIHPSGNPEGGEVMLTITNGTASCPAQKIMILPLPQTSDDIVVKFSEAMQSQIDFVVSEVGTDVQYLRDTNISAMPSEYIPISLSQLYLDAYNSLVAKGDLGVEGSMQRDLFDRLIYKTGIIEFIKLQNLASQAPLKMTSNVPVISSRGVALKSLSAGGCQVLDSNTFTLELNNNTSSLSDAMNKQRDGDSISSTEGGKKINQQLGYAATAIGLANPIAGAVTGVMAYSASTFMDYRANLYPSRFLKFDYEIIFDGMIEEDWEDTEATTGGLPDWFDAKIYAANRGWNLTKPSVDALITMASLIPFSKNAEGIAKTQIDVFAATIGIELSKINNLLSERGFDLECLEIPPKEWGPFNVSDEKWTTSSYKGTSVVKSDHSKFKPVTLGASTLNLEIKQEEFGFRYAKKEKEINILRKAVSLTAPHYVVKPGEEITLTANMLNTRVPQKEPQWEYGAAQSVNVSAGIGGVHTLTLKMPDDKALFPVKVTATSQTLTLDPLSPERGDSIDLKLNNIEISPRKLCVQPGQTASGKITATVIVADAEDTTINWSTTAGSITPSTTTGTTHQITFSAPSTKGVVTLSAAFADDADNKDEINISVGSCVEMHIFGVAGASIEPPVDDCANYNFESKSDAIELFTPDPYPLPPLKPDVTPWEGREEHLQFDGIENYFGSTMVGSECTTFNLPAESSADIMYKSDSDGNATLSMDLGYSYACATIDGDNKCSEISGGGIMNVHHFVDIYEEVDYTLSFDLECTPSSSENDYYAGFIPMQIGVAMFRYPGGTGEAVDPNYCTLDGENCTQDEVINIAPVNLTNVCEAGRDSVHLVIPIKLRGAINPEQPDLLYMYTSMIPGVPSQDYVNVMLNAARTPGTHTGTLQFTGSVKLAPSK